jgi:hypothetical protein
VKPASACPVKRASVVAGSSRSVASIDANECRSECHDSRSSPAILIRLELEAAPRLLDWLQTHPRYAALVSEAIVLEAEERAA